MLHYNSTQISTESLKLELHTDRRQLSLFSKVLTIRLIELMEGMLFSSQI